mmetsp:Transcript_885/g.2646  ORF Transcript_885/g.2646 Transcript_885/m.2646 type:complete len:294 (-) Transcript_885:375-1256(-)
MNVAFAYNNKQRLAPRLEPPAKNHIHVAPRARCRGRQHNLVEGHLDVVRVDKYPVPFDPLELAVPAGAPPRGVEAGRNHRQLIRGPLGHVRADGLAHALQRVGPALPGAERRALGREVECRLALDADQQWPLPAEAPGVAHERLAQQEKGHVQHLGLGMASPAGVDPGVQVLPQWRAVQCLCRVKWLHLYPQDILGGVLWRQQGIVFDLALQYVADVLNQHGVQPEHRVDEVLATHPRDNGVVWQPVPISPQEPLSGGAADLQLKAQGKPDRQQVVVDRPNGKKQPPAYNHAA